jgi:uncharacterized BrkB/YihY/UPF0761 family membrane protein
MPFREKMAWVSALSMLGVYGAYFGGLLWAGRQPEGVRSGGLLLTVVVLVMVQVVLTVIVAIQAPREAQAPRDERDRLIDLRAARFAYSGLATGVAVACCFAAFPRPVVFNANALLFILVTAEVMRSCCQIVQYRRGA